MIQEQELLDFMREKAYKPMTYAELSKHFEMEEAEAFKDFLKMLNGLEERGEILRTRADRYGVPERMNLLRGTLQMTAKGFGFLIPEDREQSDIYLHANDLNGAMHGDTILVRKVARGLGGGKVEGEVVRVVKRKHTQLVGTYQAFESYGFVLPDEKRIGRDIFVPKESSGGAVDGQKVVVRLVSYPEGRSSAEGEIVEILGHKNDPGVDILSVIRKYQLPEGFPEEVMAEAMAAPDTIRPEELAGRRDLRDKTIVTIDGEDAKDLDDAVCVEELPGGRLRLYVSIADVGYYVKEGSALDREAYERGCSVYLVDRVIPMLPHRLSNGICSLNPQVDRLTLTCEMTFDEQAQVVSHDIYPSVIRTVERMSYTNVRKVLQGEDPDVTERYAPLIEDFRRMEKLAKKLRKRRMNRGAIDFDFTEAKVLVDEEGKPTEIIKRERTIAESIIEEFMLAANETVAEHFHWMKVPFLYRIHEDPDGEKLMNFVQFVGNFGYVVRGKGNTVHPRALQSILEEIKGTKEETVISTVMLRSMKQAKYDAESLGHFGLAAEYYSHFTSPIRRYPDLVIHRVIREVIEQGTLSASRHDALNARMPDIARQSSERERLAADAERDTEQMKKAEFMADKIGQEFEGIISSVTNFGMFVELDNTVDGLIRLSDLHDDYYHYHEQHHALIGERTSKVYRIGDEVKVRVARVNLDEYTIDFEMLEQKSRGEKLSLVDVGRGRRRGDDREGSGRGGAGGGTRGAGDGRGRGGSGAGKGGSGKGGYGFTGFGGGANDGGGGGGGRRRKGADHRTESGGTGAGGGRGGSGSGKAGGGAKRHRKGGGGSSAITGMSVGAGAGASDAEGIGLYAGAGAGAGAKGGKRAKGKGGGGRSASGNNNSSIAAFVRKKKKK